MSTLLFWLIIYDTVGGDKYNTNMLTNSNVTQLNIKGGILKWQNMMQVK